jgi:hypothetical protein
VGSYMRRKRRDAYHVSSGGDERIRTAVYSFCRAVPYHLATSPVGERETGIEPATFSLARRCSTTEPLPHVHFRVYDSFLSLYACVIKIPHS